MTAYRKPKRVRTAFSPTQLLRLEHAFEKNHYVVGQERKELSASLNLSETQVLIVTKTSFPLAISTVPPLVLLSYSTSCSIHIKTKSVFCCSTQSKFPKNTPFGHILG